MLVYGDRQQRLRAEDKARGIDEGLRALQGQPPGIESHGELAALLIEAGELAQGIADRDFRLRGQDGDSPVQASAMRGVEALARSVVRSWESGLTRLPLPEHLPGIVDLPGEDIVCRAAEGFAFYALYPEAYASAATRSGLGAETGVIGIRSVGVTLGAIVQATLGSAAACTVRPVGHPFSREVRLDPALLHRMIQPGRGYVIVDEGPGLSGSSFGAVLDMLARHGVPEDRTHLFPSHDNEPGPRSSPDHLLRWRRLAHHVASFDDVALNRQHGARHLPTWVSDLVGEPLPELRYISGGGWRSLREADEDGWPPVAGLWERRKFIVEASGKQWLLKFGGLGREGQRKTAMAKRLADHGYAPPVAGWRHGFHVERWLGDARPLDLRTTDPQSLAIHVGRYIGFRARAFQADAGAGASLAELVEMARHNTSKALGAEHAEALLRWTPAEIARLSGRARPGAIDGRMHAWEWLDMPDGRLLKADAVDHHAGHDLVGCQDMTWDLAGAIVELDLPSHTHQSLFRAAEGMASAPVDHDLLDLMLPCYLAFQLGAFTMAAESTSDSAERQRLLRQAEGYAVRLQRESLANHRGPD